MKVNKMQKILVNGKSTAIEDFINLFQHDDEFDADSFGACFDGDTFDKTIDSFESSYDTFELVERYLQLASEPIRYDEVIPCQT